MNKIIVLTFVGSELVGKTSLINKFSNYKHSIVRHAYEGKEYEIQNIDTAGHDGDSKMRQLLLSMADIVLICFSLNNKDSFQDVSDLWISEVRKYSKGKPVILIGTKMDLEQFITEEEIKCSMDGLNARGLVKCSSLTGEGVEEVFNTAIAVYNENKSHKKRCSIS